MEGLGKSALEILQYLLPGFLSAWIFYAFTTWPKPAQFERVIQALIFTLIVRTLIFPVKLLLAAYPLFRWDQNSELITSTFGAFVVGVTFSYFANNDKFHKLARKLSLTNETSYPSEWFGTFSENVTYVVLHLDGERRLYGWPTEWPSSSDRGHFFLQDVSWLTEDGQIPITGVTGMLVCAKDVLFVEFMNETWKDK